MLKMHPAQDALYLQVGDDRDHIGWRHFDVCIGMPVKPQIESPQTLNLKPQND